jgi:hypothetical protein
MAFTVTVRRTGKTTRERADSLDAAVSMLEQALKHTERRSTVKAFSREIEPVMQVVARGELRGPGVRAGVDVRGDGSAEAFTGRWRKQLVEQQRGEDAFAALRRVLR